jgi:hypothetical protein
LFAEKDLELSICGHLSTIESLRAEIISVSDQMACEEKQYREALADKEQEHVLKLNKLDERIRRVLAAKGGDMLIHPKLSSSMIIITYDHHLYRLYL